MNSNKKTILIADDDVDLLDQLQMILESEGYDVISCDGQKSAEEELAKKLPDMAIVDLMMENADSGFILSYKIKQLKSDLPVILISSVTSETGIHFDTAGDVGKDWVKADLVMDKGMRNEQLLFEIKKLFNR